MLNQRFARLKQMMDYLAANYVEMQAYDLLEWLDLYKNILVSNSFMYPRLIQPPRREKQPQQQERDSTHEVPHKAELLQR